MVWVLLATICVSQTKPPSSESSKNRRISIFALFTVFILIASLSICVAQWYFYHRASKEWEKIRPFYTMKAYSKIIDDYIRLYPQLNHDPKFIFEYAMTLRSNTANNTPSISLAAFCVSDRLANPGTVARYSARRSSVFFS